MTATNEISNWISFCIIAIWLQVSRILGLTEEREQGSNIGIYGLYAWKRARHLMIWDGEKDFNLSSPCLRIINLQFNSHICHSSVLLPYWSFFSWDSHLSFSGAVRCVQLNVCDNSSYFHQTPLDCGTCMQMHHLDQRQSWSN